jgi:hypothetical protein
MNFKLLLCTVALAAPAFLFSQKEIVVSEQDKSMSAGTKNCYVMVIPQAKLKDVTDAWKKLVRKDAKGKPEDNNGELVMVGASNKNISAAPLTITGKLVETSEGVQVSAWISDGDFISTTSAPDKSVAVKKYLHDFGAQQYKEAVKDELEAEQKKSKDMEKVYDGFVKDQKKAESNIESHKKDIEKLQNKIKDEEANITKAQSNQTTSRAEADKQKIVVQQVTDKMNNIK